MTARRAIIATFALLFFAVIWWRMRRVIPDDTTPAAAAISTPTRSPINVRPAAATEEPSHLADTLNSPSTDIAADLRVVNDVIEAFRTNFPRDGNPVGSNAEITATLTGQNNLRLALIPTTHRAINRDGELCDRWGTPFFFHAESATRMEIRSAGPDQKMWTDDDVTFAP